MIKVAIADDHPLFREGLKTILDTSPEAGISLVDDVESAAELMQLLREAEVDVVLMDISMPETDGLQATRHIRQHHPLVKVLILSMLEDERFVAEALQAGASGYLTKTVKAKELVRAIQTAAGGEMYIATHIALKMLEKMPPARLEASIVAETGESNLSRRELEVLRLIAQGHTTTHMADILFTSKRTIESHRQHLLEKTGAKNTAALIAFAASHHLLD
jgi:DNA-binding NarL/FixJ family response regulator